MHWLSCGMVDNALAGCYVISLRPVGAHAGMRRAAADHGARVLALSPWKLVCRDDALTRDSLRRALDCDRVLFSSPAAVRAAASLQPLRMRSGQPWLTIGASTAAALRHAGVTAAIAPARMDSEGLLALPELQRIQDLTIGMVTAPDGRDLLLATLQRRGARIVRADVYAREPSALSPRAIRNLQEISAPMWLPVSSGEALQRVLSALPMAARLHLQQARVVVASTRLAQLAQTLGFADVVLAESAQPRDLIAAAARAISHPLA
jgi:uroporphyrinogen-III synthase